MFNDPALKIKWPFKPIHISEKDKNHKLFKNIINMIITRTPFRISFLGGGSDMKSFYKNSPGISYKHLNR